MTRVTLNLRLVSPALFKACRIFYEALGFKLLKDIPAAEVLLVNYALDITLRLVCLDSEKEEGDLIDPINLNAFDAKLWAIFTVDSMQVLHS